MATINRSVKDLPQLPTELVERLVSFVKTEQDLGLINISRAWLRYQPRYLGLTHH